MGLRPARTCRDLSKVAWTRFSKRKPGKSFVKAMPHNQVQIFDMGNSKLNYEVRFDLIAETPIQARDNALESARQSANKYLEKLMPGNYYLKVLVFPHNVIRENKMILGAGADRLQKGMRHSFGRPSDRGARINTGQIVFSIRVMEKDEDKAREAFKRAKIKMPGSYRVVKTRLVQ
jgi:large subunit ribosomal protein L10e